MAKSTKATELVYTEKELAAIEALRNAGVAVSAKEAGVQSITLTGLIKKAGKVDNGELADPKGEVVHIAVEDVEEVCPTCGAKSNFKRYSIVG